MKKPSIQKIVLLCTFALFIGVLAAGLFSYNLNTVAEKDDSITVVQKIGTIPETTDELEQVTQKIMGSAAPSPDDVSRLNEIAPAAGK